MSVQGLTKRTAATVAVFTAIQISAPPAQGIFNPSAQAFANNPAQIGALSLSYAQLVQTYRLLIRQDVPNQAATLDSNIVTAQAQIATLDATVQGITAMPDVNGTFGLQHLKQLSTHALALINAANGAPDDGQ